MNTAILKLALRGSDGQVPTTAVRREIQSSVRVLNGHMIPISMAMVGSSKANHGLWLGLGCSLGWGGVEP